MRWWWLVILLGGAAYLVVVGLPGESTTAVRSAPVRAKGHETERIFAGGVVEGAHPVLPLRFEIPGRIKRVLVREGEQVKQNQLLAELEPEVWEFRVLQALAQLKIARVERDLLNTNSRQNSNVVPAGNQLPESSPTESKAPFSREGRAGLPSISSQQDFERLRQQNSRVTPQVRDIPARSTPSSVPPCSEQIAIADARIALADAAVKHEQCMLDKTRLLAPIDGTMLTVLPEPGQLVGPADEREPFSIVNRERIHVRAFVEELDAMNVAPGRKATVVAAARPEREYAGTVLSCSPYVQPKSHRHLKPGERLDVRVREIVIELQNGSDLLIGLPVDVFIDPPSSGSTKPRADDSVAPRLSLKPQGN